MTSARLGKDYELTFTCGIPYRVFPIPQQPGHARPPHDPILILILLNHCAYPVIHSPYPSESSATMVGNVTGASP